MRRQQSVNRGHGSRWARRALFFGLLSLPGLGIVALGVGAAVEFNDKRECVLSGGVWRAGGPSIPTWDDCVVFGERVPIGTRYFDGCNTCTCLGYLHKCTSKYCLSRGTPALCQRASAACFP